MVLPKYVDQTIDILKPIKNCTIDLFCQTALGQSANAQLAKEDESSYAWAIEMFGEIVIYRTASCILISLYSESV